MIKPLLALAAAAALALPVAAQTARGTILLGATTGNLRYEHPARGNHDLSAALYPTAGYFVADNLLVGVAPALSYEHGKDTYPAGYNRVTVDRTLGYGLGLFGRYYALNRGRHHVFGEAGADLVRYGFRRIETLDGHTYKGPRGHADAWSLRAGAGYNYFVTTHLALEANLGYQRFGDDPIDRRRSEWALRVGLAAFLPTLSAAN